MATSLEALGYLHGTRLRPPLVLARMSPIRIKTQYALLLRFIKSAYKCCASILLALEKVESCPIECGLVAMRLLNSHQGWEICDLDGFRRFALEGRSLVRKFLVVDPTR